MATCHILSELSDVTGRLPRERGATAVFERLGFKTRLWDRSVCDATRAEHMPVQHPNFSSPHDGWKVDFADQVNLGLEPEAGDVVVALAAWQSIVFKNLLASERGRFKGAPVLELFIDYTGSFAVWRAFTSYYAMGLAAAADCCVWDERRIVSDPCVPGTINPESETTLYNANASAPLDVSYLVNMVGGFLIVAPDFGSWHELVDQGVTGLLYRTEAGHAKCLEFAPNLNRQRLLDAAGSRFGVDTVATRLKPWVERALA